MKRGVIGLLVAVLSLSLAAVVDAKGGKKNTGDLKGKIVGVSAGKVIIQTKGSKTTGGSTQVTVKVDANTTVEIDGVSGKKVTDLQAGERVVIQGGVDGPATDIQATSHGKGHKKNSN